MKIRLAALVSVLLLAAPGARAAVVRPANDSFAKAKLVGTVPWSETRNTASATLESHETQSTCGRARATVWYKVTPAQTTPIGVSSMGSGYDTTLAVYTGSKVSKLSQLSCSDNAGAHAQSMVGWLATAGITYFIQAGTNAYDRPGTLALRVTYGYKLDGSPGTDTVLGGVYFPFAVAGNADPAKQEAAVRFLAEYCVTKAFCFAFDMVDVDTSHTSKGGVARFCLVSGTLCYDAVTP